MPTRFGARNALICPECKNMVRLTRSTPYPKYGYDFELQTFTCRACKHEVESDADCTGEIAS
jgi:hypothetical protein